MEDHRRLWGAAHRKCHHGDGAGPDDPCAASLRGERSARGPRGSRRDRDRAARRPDRRVDIAPDHVRHRALGEADPGAHRDRLLDWHEVSQVTEAQRAYFKEYEKTRVRPASYAVWCKAY